jgi:hypothetical protein
MTCFSELTGLVVKMQGEPDVKVDGPERQSATWLINGHSYGYNFTGDGPKFADGSLHPRLGFHVWAPGASAKICSTRPGWISLPIAVTHLIYVWDLNWDARITKIPGGWP